MIHVRQHALADSDQFAVVAQSLDVARVGRGAKRRRRKIASLPDVRGADRVQNHRGKFRQQFGRGNQRLCQPPGRGQLFELRDRARLLDA